ncbi:Carbonic anhydrase [Pyrenophora teres f. maculata]|nr:Carbonic anhydrase [Pyrenophora teres f. maculata]
MTVIIDPLTPLLTGNTLYRDRTTTANPTFFTTLALGQSPSILWIGCADSRVPETTVCHCAPGDIFVHRNIANTVHVDDVNAASVVEYAVAHLRVRTVVVCGHTKCGGVGAALGDEVLGGALDVWLGPVRGLRRQHETELDALPDDDARAVRLAELNVRRSVDALREHPAVKKAIAERGLGLHGLIYDIGAGHLRVINEEDRKLKNGSHRSDKKTDAINTQYHT